MQVIDLDSAFRDRVQFPNPAAYTIPLAPHKDTLESAEDLAVYGSVVYPEPTTQTITFYRDRHFIDYQPIAQLWNMPLMFRTSSPYIIEIHPRVVMPLDTEALELEDDALMLVLPADTFAASQNVHYEDVVEILPPWNNAFAGRVLEDIRSGEYRTIKSSTYSTEERVLQTCTIVAFLSETELEVRTDVASQPLSTLPYFYHGVRTRFEDGSERMCVQYDFSLLNVATVRLDAPVSPLAVPVGSRLVFFSEHTTTLTLEEPLPEEADAYPSMNPWVPLIVNYEDDRYVRFGFDIQYPATPVPVGSEHRVFSLALTRLSTTNIGVAVITEIGILFYASDDPEGTEWTLEPVEVETWTAVPDCAQFVQVSMTLINSNPTIVYGSTTNTILYMRASDAAGTAFNVEDTLIDFTPTFNLSLHAIPAQGINGTGATTDAGYPEIAFTYTNTLQIARGSADYDAPTWVITDFGFCANTVRCTEEVNDTFARFLTVAGTLLARTAIYFQFENADGFGVSSEAVLVVDEGGGPVSVAIPSTYYATEEEIADALETALNAALGDTYTVTLTDSVLTIASTGTFSLDGTDTAAWLFGFTALPTATAASHTGVVTMHFPSTSEGQMACMRADAANTGWEMSTSALQFGEVDNFYVATLATNVGLYTGVGDNIHIRTACAVSMLGFVVGITGSVACAQVQHRDVYVRTTFVDSIALASEATRVKPMDYSGTLNYTFPITATQVLAGTTYTFIPVLARGPRGVLRQTVFVTSTRTLDTNSALLQQSPEYDYQLMPTHEQNSGQNAAFFVVTQTERAGFSPLFAAHAPMIDAVDNTTVQVPSYYRIRGQAPWHTGGDCALTSTARQLVVADPNTLPSQTPADYLGAYLYVYNTPVYPTPANFVLFNAMVRVIEFEPPATFHFSPFLSDSLVSTVPENFEITSDYSTLVFNLGGTVSIPTGTYADLDAVLQALEALALDWTVTVDDQGIVNIENGSADSLNFPSNLSAALGLNSIFALVSAGQSVTGLYSANFVNPFHFEVWQYDAPQSNPLIYNGTGIQQRVCYEILCDWVILPNVELTTGSRIAYYPYTYIELSDVQEGSAFFQMRSNNPHAARAVFKLPINNLVAPDDAAFVPLRGTGAVQHIWFRPNTPLFLRIYLADGQLFEPLLSDTSPPLPPNPLLQISCTFLIKRVKYGETCA